MIQSNIIAKTTQNATPRNLFLLLVIFVSGIGIQASINLKVESYISDLDKKVRNAEVENLLGQEVILEIYKIESAFYELSTFPNQHLRKIIKASIEESEEELVHVLDILNEGGTYKHRIDLNLPNTKEQYEILFYEPSANNTFSFARADILPKISILDEKFATLNSGFETLERYRKDLDPRIFSTIESLKLELKLLKPIFHRVKEDANRIFYHNKLNFQKIRSEVEQQKNYYYQLQLAFTLALLIIGMTAFWRLSRNINKSTEEIEESKSYTQDILDSQSNIIIVNNGKEIIDASGGFFEFFPDYPSIEAFQKDFQCICDLFVKEEGYVWKFDDKNWIEYVLEHPEIAHRVKISYKGKTTIFQLRINQSKQYRRFIISMFDITALEKVRQDLESERNIAIEATRSKGEFLANMSHEIRTPLNAILGFISLLKEKPHDSETMDYLETIDSSSHSLLGIINDILDLSKIESGKLDLDLVDFNPRRELINISDLFKARCSEKHLNLIIDLDERLPAGINTDMLRLKQVIANLLSNAIKFTEPGHQIEFKVSYKKGNLTIRVIDEGIGMSKSAQKKVFEAFSQAEGSTTRKYGGTGLGLTISSKLISMMGGKIEVTSKLGKGSEFFFTIPVKEVDLQEKKNTQTLSLSSTKFDGSLLLVEDNKTNQLLMSAIFKKLQIEFDIANDGIEAIEAIQQKTYDLVLMDENMPNLNGIEATKQIRESEKSSGVHIPIVALTANSMSGDRERFINAGMDDYLSKPINMGELTKILNQYLLPLKNTH
ncbi:ATP-binding protein [Thiomicrorhabdus indica]|uniref:ATP-binding protein n=1 Tax=Thiomicrorhabdus indica TaxID=2267253 RepID=UPI002AA93A03|nr:ATP-binding protein [Thiomicrorhabdus indica]